MNVMNGAQALLAELGKPAVDPEFSQIWSSLGKELRAAIALLAIDYSSALVRNYTFVTKHADVAIVPCGFEPETKIACAVLSLVWLTDGNLIVLRDIGALEPRPDAEFVEEWQNTIAAELIRFGSPPASRLHGFLERRLKEASFGSNP